MSADCRVKTADPLPSSLCNLHSELCTPHNAVSCRYNPPVAKQTTSTGRPGHFGQFVRWHRVNAGKTTEAYGRDVGLTGRRVIAIEAMAAPGVQHTTLVALARSMGLSVEELDDAWRSTPVPQTRRRSGPTTDGASRFAAACAAAGIEPPEGMRRLRRWFIDQPAEVQRAALSSTASQPVPTFTIPVDHLQDPRAAQAARLAARAGLSAPLSSPSPSPSKRKPAGAARREASSARSPAPAATAGSRRR